MEIFLLLLRLALAGLFGVAGIAKIFDPEVSTTALAGFGVPPRPVRTVAALLRVVELGGGGTP